MRFSKPLAFAVAFLALANPELPAKAQPTKPPPLPPPNASAAPPPPLPLPNAAGAPSASPPPLPSASVASPPPKPAAPTPKSSAGAPAAPASGNFEATLQKAEVAIAEAEKKGAHDSLPFAVVASVCDAPDFPAPDDKIAARALAAAQRATAFYRRVGRHELAYRARLCAHSAITDRNKQEKFSTAQRALLADTSSLLSKWLADDAPNALGLRRALGADSKLVAFHLEKRETLAAELACVKEYLAKNQVTLECSLPNEGFPRIFAVIGPHMNKHGAGSTSGAIMVSARPALGLDNSAAAFQALERIGPTFEKTWGSDAVNVTVRWMRGLMALDHGNEIDAAKLMPDSDLDLPHKRDSWFGQLLLLRSRAERDRGHVSRALDLSGRAIEAYDRDEPNPVLEHAENLRAAGRMREAEIRLEAASHTNGVCHAPKIKDAPPPTAEQREATLRQLQKDAAFTKQLGKFLEDVRYCRATNPETTLALLTGYQRDNPAYEEDEILDPKENRQPKSFKIFTALKNAISNSPSLRGGPDLATCARIEKAMAPASGHLPLENPLASVLNDLAVTRYATGRYEDATKSLDAARCWARSQPQRVRILSNLGGVQFTMGKLGEAEQTLTDASMYAEALQAETPLRVRVALDANLGKIALAKNDLLGAQKRFSSALMKIGTTDRALQADVLDDLGMGEDFAGHHDAAEKAYREALRVRESFGADFPPIATSLSNIATLDWARGKPKESLPTFQKMLALEEEQLVRLLVYGTETSKRDALARLSDRVDWLVTLDQTVLKNDPTATQLAFSSIMSRQGRALDAATRSHGALFAKAPAKAKQSLTQLRAANERLVHLTLNGPADSSPEGKKKHADELEQLRGVTKVLGDQIQAELGVLDREAVKGLEGGAQAIAKQLQPTQALVNYVVYRPFHPEKPTARYDAPRYAAYVLAPSGTVQRVDLGPTAKIDDAVARWRQVLTTRSQQHIAIANELHALVFAPVEPLLAGARDLHVVADSNLNLIPFEALSPAKGLPLLATHRFAMLTSARDLANPLPKSTSGTDVMVFANPDFGVASSAPPKSNEALLGRATFIALPGTATEAQGIAKSFPNAKVLQAAAANGTAFRDLRSPTMLHVATHGFFIGAPGEAATKNTTRGLELDGFLPAETTEVSALVRSGLAFSGANQRQSGSIVAGLELAQVDLTGTRLVTLSACESGVGETVSGDGVYGVRRALYLAGSETQVLSLWKVDDEATSELMIHFYAHLRDGMSRGEALRQSKLALSSSRFSHPYFWSAFILGGNPNKLDGSPAEPIGALRHPGQLKARGGCMCRAGESQLEETQSESRLAATFVLLFVAVTVLRRAVSSGNGMERVIRP